MIKASNAYKSAMKAKIRDRAYISVTIGVVNGQAQNSAQFSGNYAWWGDKLLPFRNDSVYVEYATLEKKYMRADGQMVFLPRNDGLYQLKNAPLTTESVMGRVTVAFPQEFSIKGLTINFGKYFPTKFQIVTADKTTTYTNDKEEFTTTDVIGDIEEFVIVPLEMTGGDKRMRIQKIVMGIGLTYRNADVSSSSFEELSSAISAELPYEKFNVTVLDNNGMYNVDDSNSFINFLETGQTVEVSYGMTLEDDSVEWIKKASLYLSDWNSQKNQMSFVATDIFATMTDEYNNGYKIYDRTAYEEAISILTDVGLEPDQYFVDECLRDITLHNPMPKATHAECLQLLCNATRCSFRQDENGKIMIKANFANVVDPEDMVITSTQDAWWSNAQNVLYGSNSVYADLTRHFIKADGSQLFLPKIQGTQTATTGYVSSVISDVEGNFTENPTLSIQLPAAYTYFGVYVKFQGNPPKEMKVKTYNNGTLKSTFTYTNLAENALLNDEFADFDVITFEITKGYPRNRVLIDKISFGDLSDYLLKKDSMLENPYGYADRKIKDIFVKVYTFQNDESGEPQEVEDNVYLKKNINNAGEVKYCGNQLISTTDHARLVAEWLANYYANQISYDVNYRGDPIIGAPDMLYMESDVLSSLQVEVEKHTLKFNGAFSGSLQLRRAMRT